MPTEPRAEHDACVKCAFMQRTDPFGYCGLHPRPRRTASDLFRVALAEEEVDPEQGGNLGIALGGYIAAQFFPKTVADIVKEAQRGTS